MIVQERIDRLNDLFLGLPNLPRVLRQWQLNRFPCSTLEANVHCERIVAHQSYILQQESHYALSLSVWSGWIAPELREA